eukprot:989912-Prymnesium_polylepis.1
MSRRASGCWLQQVPEQVDRERARRHLRARDGWQRRGAQVGITPRLGSHRQAAAADGRGGGGRRSAGDAGVTSSTAHAGRREPGFLQGHLGRVSAQRVVFVCAVGRRCSGSAAAASASESSGGGRWAARWTNSGRPAGRKAGVSAPVRSTVGVVSSMAAQAA